MDKKILNRIVTRSGVPDLPEILSDRLTESDLNTLLLEVFHRRSKVKSPAVLLQNYRNNRFVQPVAADAVGLSGFLLDWLTYAATAGFTPLELSPVCPLGTCSIIATAHQNKVVSALRGTEVVADATNVLALESAVRRQREGFPTETRHFSAVHRHVRAQEVPDMPGYSPHFSILGLTSAGRDKGGFDFEKENLWRHIHFYRSFLEDNMHISPIKLSLRNLGGESGDNRIFDMMHEFLREKLFDLTVETAPTARKEQAYYCDVQFKIVIPMPDGGEMEIADGGFTDWTRQLTGNRKERLLISGIGLELLYKMTNGLL